MDGEAKKSTGELEIEAAEAWLAPGKGAIR